MFFFDSDPAIARIMGGMYDQGSFQQHACEPRFPYTSPTCIGLNATHPDDGIAFQIPRNVDDVRFEQWGSYVHPQHTNYASIQPPSACMQSSYMLHGARY